MRKICVAGHENNDLGPHIYGKLDRIDRHQDVHICFVMLAVTRRPFFYHYEESVGAKPMQELVLLVSFALPLWQWRRQAGIDDHLDQFPSFITVDQIVAEP